MVARLFLELVTPNNILVSSEVDEVYAPGSLGIFGVLPGHIPLLSGIVPGEVRYKIGSNSESFAVTTGFAEVLNNRVSILVDAAESIRTIDIERAKNSLKRAQERIAESQQNKEIDMARANASMLRALNRVKIASKR